MDSDLTITGSSFVSNKAKQGSALSTTCSESCNVNIESSTFSNNMATEQGGAIQYQSFRPTMTSLTFTGNSAPYGPDISSYPTKFSLDSSQNMKLEEVVSGQTSKKDISLALLDYDDQVLVNDDVSILEVASSGTNTVLGTSVGKVNNGKISFTDITFKDQPGTNSSLFRVLSTAVSEANVKKWLGNDYWDETSRVITADFRLCDPGEEMVSGQCSVCQAGTFTILPDQTNCESCLENAECLGGNQVKVSSGYWRSTMSSDNIYKCLNADAC